MHILLPVAPTQTLQSLSQERTERFRYRFINR